MTDTKYHEGESGTLEGRIFRPATIEELGEAVEQAFDYRGDVTLELKSGESIEGYVFNREPHGPVPFLDVFPSGRPEARVIRFADIATIAFTGKDTASGKSWEAWVAKKESDRRTEATRDAEAAKARGHL